MANIFVDCVKGEIIERISNSKIIVKNGSTISYSVSADGYFPQSDEYPIVNNEEVVINLEKHIAITVSPTPENAVVTLSAKGYDTVSGIGPQTINVSAGETVKYTVELEGYLTVEDELSANADLVKAILLRKLYTLRILIPEEEQLTSQPVVSFIAGTYRPNEDGRSITVPERTTVVYKVSCHGYEPVTNSVKLTRDTEINIYFNEYAFTLSVQTLPDDAIITFDAEEPMEGTLTANSIAVQGDTRVGYLVERDGYASVSADYPNGISSNVSVDINMKKYVYLEMIINPDDCTITYSVNTARLWQPNTKYERYALIYYNGKYYNCATPHTSDEIIDLSKWNLVTNKIWVASGSAVNYSVSRFGYVGFGSYKVISENTTITKDLTDLEYLVPEWREHPELGWQEMDAFVKENNSNQYLQKE